MADYAPLEFLKLNPERNESCGLHMDFDVYNGRSWDEYYRMIFTDILKLDESEIPSKEWFIRYVLSNDFLRNIAKHPDAVLDDVSKKRREIIETDGLKDYLDVEFFKLIPVFLKVLGYTEKDIRAYMRGKSRMQDIISEIRDSIIENLLIEQWVINKQVYKPDATFTRYLLDTKELRTTEDFFQHLPFNTFYVDLEDTMDENIFGDVRGVFVNITDLGDNKTALTCYVLSKNLLTYSHYLIFDMNLIETIETNRFDGEIEFNQIPILDDMYNGNERINVRNVMVIVLQLICYMKTKEPDIAPAPEMTYTYKPHKYGNKIKNKYSEIMKQEVGIRIGKKITQKINEMKKAEKEQREAIEKTGDKTRKPPIPHFRAAHWHRYWVGAGRTTCIVKWIEPVFVCGSYDSSKTDVVIHKVE